MSRDTHKRGRVCSKDHTLALSIVIPVDSVQQSLWAKDYLTAQFRKGCVTHAEDVSYDP